MVKLLGSILLAAQSSTELPPPVRAAAMMALLGIALLGLLLIVFIMLGGHWIRRLGHHRRGPAVPPDFFAKEKASPPNPPNPHTQSPHHPSDKPLDGETTRIDDTFHS